MLKKDNRITKKKDFDHIFKEGKSSYSSILGVKSLANGLTLNRYGIVISNKVSKKATVRNSLRRRIRALLFQINSNLKLGNDILIIVLPVGREATPLDLKKGLTAAFRKLRLSNDHN